MHAFLDKYSVAMTALILRNRWFEASVESPGFQAQLEGMTATVPEFEREGFYEVEMHAPVGKLDPAFQVVKWIGPEVPTLIYHHGNNETPFKYGAASKNTFQSILYGQRDVIHANLISIRAAFHNEGIKRYMEKMDRLENFTAMLAASVKLMEELTASLRHKGCQKVVLTGLSLGGWAVNLHRSLYNSADVYVPIFAGAALDELFLTSGYHSLVGAAARKHPDKLSATLNFVQAFKRIREHNVFPLMARHDQFIEYEVQRQCYEAEVVTVIDKGHITGALASTDLRNHILTRAGI